MKKSVFSIAFLFVLFVNLTAVANDLEWLNDFEKAKELSKEKGVPILINFTGSDWCSWCMRLMGEVFSKSEFQNYAKKELVLFKADFPRSKVIPEQVVRQNRKLAERYRIQGFPTILLVDATGKELARTGYRQGGAKAYVHHLANLIRQSHYKD
jgi:protein disulfide-isomerase